MAKLTEEEMSEEGEMSETSEDDDGFSITEKLDEDEEEKTGNLKRKLNDDHKAKHQKKQKVSLDSVCPPTVSELNQLRETANLFHSNLFRLQIEEMLKEITVKTKYQNLFQEWYDNLKTFLINLNSEEGEYNLSDKEWIGSLDVPPPVSFEPPSDKGKFKFVPPEDISICGSYELQVCLGPIFTVDLHVHIPEKFFQRMDYLNLRFDRKRALYLSILAKALQTNERVAEIQFILAHGCPLKPVLQLKPEGKVGRLFRVLLWPVSSPFALKLTRFLPSQNNIRSNWFLSHHISTKVEEESEPATPYYNSITVQDLIWQQNHQLLQVSLSAQSVRSGLHLLKVWLHQRHLDQGYGSFSGFILAMYVAYLVQNKRINSMMSSYQVARITWITLAQSDWTKQGISLSSAANGPRLEDFHKNFDVVFVDVSGFCNLCTTVNKEVYLQVKEESALAVKFLDTPGLNSFHMLFMTSVDFLQSCDNVIRFENSASLSEMVQRHSAPHLQLSHVGDVLSQALHLMLPLLRRGLGQRVELLHFHPSAPLHWDIHEKPPTGLQLCTPFQIGLHLHPSKAFSILDRGPPGNEPQAEEFRKFWGERAQLRRFRDGSVCEAAIWSDTENVCMQVVNHLLNAHLGLKQNSFIYISGLLESVLDHSQMIPSELPKGNKAAQTVIASFDRLSRQLRELRDLPLGITAIHGVSPVFRYCDVFPPLSGSYWNPFAVQYSASTDVRTLLLRHGSELKHVPLFCAPIEVVMQLEHSNKWSQDIRTVRRLKAAFLLHIAKCLHEQYNLAAHAYTDHVDVYKEGFVFRIKLGYLREVALLKKTTTTEGLVAYHNTPESQALEEKIELLPLLSSSMHGLHQQFPGFGPTARLAKRWLSAQLVGPPHMPDLVTELLVASLFLMPEPFQAPVQPQLGLFRFLRLMSCTDWRTTPLMINFNSEFTREKLLELETEFNASRQTLPPLFLSTPYDHIVSQWTRSAPTLQILIRVGMLASKALQLLETQMLKSMEIDYMPIFRPNLEDYNVLITLKTDFISRIHENIHELKGPLRKILPYKERKTEKIPIVGFDPVQRYLKDLRDTFSHCAMFFHDQFGGAVIGVLWKPIIKEERDFKVSHINCQKLTNKGKMCFNIDGILEDFHILGQGLIETIENKD